MQKRSIKWYLKTGLTTALLVLCGSLQAAPHVSTKAMGMAGASVANGQDSLTAFYNPATATSVESRIDIEGDVQYSKGELRIGSRTGGAQIGRFKTQGIWDGYGAGGLNWRLGCCDDFALGLQWNNYDDINVRYRDHLTDFSGANTDKVKFHHRTDVLTFNSAYNLNENHTFGVGVNVYFSWLDVRGLQAFQALSNAPGNVTNRGTDDATGVGVTLGWLGSFKCDTVKFGFAYSPRVRMQDFDKYSGLLSKHRIDIPETFRVGGSYKLDCCTTLAADWEYRSYSEVQSLSNDFLGNGTVFTPPFGSTNGPGFGWRNSWALKLGAEKRLGDSLVARIGYRHERGPIRRNGHTETPLNALTLRVIQEYLSFGFSYDLDSCSEVSFYSETGWDHYTKSNLPTIGPSSTALIINGAKFQYNNFSQSLGLAYGRRF